MSEANGFEGMPPWFEAKVQAALLTDTFAGEGADLTRALMAWVYGVGVNFLRDMPDLNDEQKFDHFFDLYVRGYITLTLSDRDTTVVGLADGSESLAQLRSRLRAKDQLSMDKAAAKRQMRQKKRLNQIH